MRCAPGIGIRAGISTLVLCALAISACVGSGKMPDPDNLERPAVLLSPTDTTRTELAQAVSEGLNGSPVRLADEALTSDSQLIITRAQHRDSMGLPIEGRSREKPEHFRLVEQAGRCILIQERTGRRWVLHSARCSPVAAH